MMTIPAYNEMFYECLSFFMDKQPHHIRELRKHLASSFGVSDEEQHQLIPTGRQPLFDNRCGWCKSYLYGSNLLVKLSRGIYQISKSGIIIFNKVADNSELNLYVNKNYHNNDSVPLGDIEKGGNDVVEKCTPDERIADIFQSISEKLVNELLSKILEQTPEFFERLVINLLERMGYGGYDSSVTQPSKDGGIDGIINEDKLGFGKIYIQAKKWDVTQTIGRPEIQKFSGALHEINASKGLFITTARFSKEAKDSAKKNNIILVDGEKLASLMIEYDFGVSTERVYKIKRIDSDFFDDEED